MELSNSLEHLYNHLTETTQLEPVEEEVEWFIRNDSDVLPLKGTIHEIASSIATLSQSIQSVLYIRFSPPNDANTTNVECKYIVYFRLLSSALEKEQVEVLKKEVKSITIFPERPDLDQIFKEVTTIRDDIQTFCQYNPSLADIERPVCTVQRNPQSVTLSFKKEYLSTVYNREVTAINPDTYTVWELFNDLTVHGEYITVWFYETNPQIQQTERPNISPSFQTSVQQMEVYDLLDCVCPDCNSTTPMELLFTDRYEDQEKLTVFCPECFTAYSCSTIALGELLDNTESLDALEQNLPTYINKYSKIGKNKGNLEVSDKISTEDKIYPPVTSGSDLTYSYSDAIGATLNAPTKDTDEEDGPETMRVQIGNFYIDNIPVTIDDDLYIEAGSQAGEFASCFICGTEITEQTNILGSIKYSLAYYIRPPDDSQIYQISDGESGDGNPHICKSCCESIFAQLATKLKTEYHTHLVTWNI